MEAPRRSASGLVVSLALYFALRVLILVSNFDEVAMPQFELFPMGTIPLLLEVDGALPIARVYDNAAGQLLTGLLAVPCYALFGPTYLALKLVPLLLGALALTAVWAGVRAAVDTRAATAAGLMFALAPTTLTKYSLMASGNHFETITFTALALWTWIRVARSTPTPIALGAFGLACGFALFVFLGALTPIALLLVAHIGMRGPRAALRDAPWIAAGFALGVAPLVALNLSAGARGLEFLGTKFGGASAELDFGVVLERLRLFCFVHLPEASQFHDWGPLPGRAARVLFLAAFVLGYAMLFLPAVRAVVALVRIWFGRAGEPAPRPELSDMLAAIACAYLPLTALAFSLSSLRIEPRAPPMDAEGYRYFNTHFLFATIVIARAAHRSSGTARGLGRMLPAAALLAGLFNFALVDWRFENANVGAYFDGFKLRQVATQLLSPRNGFSRAQIVQMIEAHPVEHRTWLYQGVGRAVAAQRFLASRGGRLELWSALDDFPAQRRSDVARGMGTCFRHLSRVRGELDPRFVELASAALRIGQPFASDAVGGLAQDWEVAMPRDLERDMSEMEALAASLPHELRESYARGFGAVCAHRVQRGLPLDLRLVEQAAQRVDAQFLPSFSAGFGAGLAEVVRAGRGPEDPIALLGAHADRVLIEERRRQRAEELRAELGGS